MLLENFSKFAKSQNKFLLCLSLIMKFSYINLISFEKLREVHFTSGSARGSNRNAIEKEKLRFFIWCGCRCEWEFLTADEHWGCEFVWWSSMRMRMWTNKDWHYNIFYLEDADKYELAFKVSGKVTFPPQSSILIQFLTY